MELGEVYVKIGADTKELEKGLTKSKGQVKKTAEQMKAQMKAVGKKMAIVGVAITAAFALTVKSAMSFQKQLAQVSTMLDESAMKIMPQYKKGLLDMSMAFGESTDTLSRGLYDILSASIPPAKALDVLGVAAKAATAGITDTGVAADAITTVLNSYGMSADQAEKVSDILFATVKRGKLTFNELAPAIGKSAALAATAGLSFEDLTATVATLTRAGIRTDEAMTSINGVLRAFLKPTDDAKEAAKEFGLELNTSTLRTIGMTGVMELLKDATAEQLAAIFPNIRGLKGMAAALGDAEGYAKDYALMLNSAGLTQIAFAKQSATLSFKLDQAKQSINVVAVTIGDILMPTVEKIIAYVTNLTKKVKEWAEANKPLVETIVKCAAGLGLALAVLGPILIILPGIITALGLLKVAFIPFLIGGAIILGLTKMSELFRDIKEKAFEAYTGFKDWSLEQLEKGIAEVTKIIADLEAELEEADKGFNIFGMTLKNQDVNVDRLKQVIKDYKIELGLLEEQRDKLTGAEKEGADVTEELTKIDKAMADQQEALNKLLEEYAEGLEDIPLEIEEILKGSALLSAQMSLLKTEFENSNKTLEDTQEYYKGMVELLGEYIEQLKVEIKNERESTPTWFAKNEELLKAVGLYGEIKKAIAELDEAQKKIVVSEEAMAQATGKVYNKWYELAKLWAVRPDLQTYFKMSAEALAEFGKGVGEVTVSEEAMAQATGEVYNKWYELAKLWAVRPDLQAYFGECGEGARAFSEELKTAAEIAWERWETFLVDLANKYGDTITILQNGISGFVSSFESGLTDAITSLLTMSEANAKIKEDMEEENQIYLDAMEQAQAEYDAAVIAGDDVATENALQNMANIKEEHEQTLASMEGDMVTTGGIAETFWDSLKKAAITALAEIIAKMLILKGLMLLFSAFGIPTGWLAGLEKGGEVELAKGGKVKKYQKGGMGTDTVPAMLTPGEYVISKPMVDFIKRTGAVTGNLVDAIRSGTRTPVPAFATGGSVSNPISNTYNQQRSYSNPINIQPGAIQIITPKFSDEDAKEMFRLIEREAGYRGLAFGRV